MDPNVRTPENLHELSGSKITTGNKFVNPGTPEKALVTEADKPKSEISMEASKRLRDNLNK